jgi:phosphotransferase system enzyme I (PtsI)
VKKSVLVRGDAVVDGVVIDRVFVYNPAAIVIPERMLTDGQASTEVQRFRLALGRVREQLERDKVRVQNELGRQEADIFQSHIMIAADPFFTTEVPGMIEEEKKNAEWIIYEGLKPYVETFNSLDNEYLKERIRDIEDVSTRIINTLQEEKAEKTMKQKRGILVLKELVPSMIAHIDSRKVKAIVAELGGPTSHATILAKSLGLPFIINVKNITELASDGDLVIVDGHAGEVIINPAPVMMERYKKTGQEYQDHLRVLKKDVKTPAVTRDGKRISLLANIERTSGVNVALKYGAEGVGLFRTELPFILGNRLLSEEEQFDMYKTVLRSFKDRPVTIRTLDMGGDKFFPFQEASPFMESNPFLGLRSIRLSLLKPDIFRIQIRAIFRASVFGRARVLLPMISSVEELEQVNTIIEEEKILMSETGTPFDPDIPVGIMVEIPSAALSAEQLIQRCDFFSIGTNDLTQYTLAVDRSNERVRSYYIPENPAVLVLMKNAASAAIGNGKVCSLCGELAGNPLFTSFFLGIGITELSMEPNFIPEVKNVVHNVSLRDSELLAKRLLGMSKVDEIRRCLSEFLRGSFGRSGPSSEVDE